VVRAEDWPGWLGPARNSSSTEIILPWSETPKQVWKQPIGNGFSVPVVGSNRLFAHAQVDQKQAEEVVAIDTATGEVAWGDAYDRDPYRSALGAGPRATPVLGENRLVTYGITGVLTCYDPVDGKRLWQVRPYTDLKATLPTFGVCSSPVIVKGKVVVPVG